MTDKLNARAVEEKVRENGKRPPEELFQDLFQSGLIDEDGRVHLEQLVGTQDLLSAKGFAEINASHSDHVPGGVIRLRETIDGGRRAEGPYKEIRKIIEGTRDQQHLWKSLAAAGYCKKARQNGRKKPEKRAS